MPFDPKKFVADKATTQQDQTTPSEGFDPKAFVQSKQPAPQPEEDLLGLVERGIGEFAQGILPPPIGEDRFANTTPEVRAFLERVLPQPRELPDVEPQSLTGEAVLFGARNLPNLVVPGGMAAARGIAGGVGRLAKGGIKKIGAGVQKAGGVKELAKDVASAAVIEAISPGAGALAPIGRRILRNQVRKQVTRSIGRGAKRGARAGRQAAKKAPTKLKPGKTSTQLKDEAKALTDSILKKKGATATQPAKKVPQLAPKKKPSVDFKGQRAQAQSFKALVEVGRARGMAKPEKWARHVLRSRQQKLTQELRQAGSVIKD